MESAPDMALLDESNSAFIQQRVTINVAAAGPGNRPSVARALGCRVSSDRRTVTVFLSPATAGALIDELRGNPRIAAVFSQPSTHRTIQLKGTDACIVPLEQGDLEHLATQRQAFIADLAELGYRDGFARAVIPEVSHGVAAVRFTPVEAYRQTPGPDAGRPL